LQQPIRQSAAVADHPGTVGRLPKAIDRHELVARIAPLVGKLAGAGISLGSPDCIEPFGREQRQAAGQLQFDLSSIASRSFRPCGQCRETAVEMADRFEMGGALGGVLPGLQPLIDRALDSAGGSQMVRQEFGLALDEIGKMLLQQCCYACVQLLPSGAQQSAVGGVLH